MLSQSAPLQVILAARAGIFTQAVPFHYYGRYRFESGPSFGGSVEVTRVNHPLSLRLEVGRTPSRPLTQDADPPGPPLFGPGSGSFTTFTVALALAPRQTCVGPVCPRLLLGGGQKWYRFDADVLNDDIVQPFAEDQVPTTLQVGAGLAVHMSRGVFLVEVSDFGNRLRMNGGSYTTKRVHDTVVSLGLGVRLGKFP